MSPQLTTQSQPISASLGLENDFYEKVGYNFKLQVLLCLKGSNCNRHDVLRKIYLLNGYRCHKVAKYGLNWSHLHVRFTAEDQAKLAVDYFKSTDLDLTAVLVDELLRDWYSYELRSNLRPAWTQTVIDVVGHTPKHINLLSVTILNGILEDFGKPFLSPYTAALPEPHVQVFFDSMTEALAACMAFGPWYRTNLKTDQCFYRVRISPSVREALLIGNSGGIPEEAFKLDYFLNHKRIVKDRASGAFQKGDRSTCLRKTQRDGKAHGSTEKFEKPQPIGFKPRSPIICIPVIARPVTHSILPTQSAGSHQNPSIHRKDLDRANMQEVTVSHAGDPNEARVSDVARTFNNFDNARVATSANHAGADDAFQPTPHQSVPCEMTYDDYCGKTLVFENGRYRH